MNSNVIKISTTIKQALEVIDKLAGQTLFVVDDNKTMIGTLTDGDIRRGLIKGLTLNSEIESLMSKKFKFLSQNVFSLEKINEIKNAKIDIVPILSDNKKIIDIVDFREIQSVLPVEAIIMAGGKGSRLSPLTLTTPKPLLKIANKPIIEYNIDRLIKFGIKKIYISVNYLKEQIIEYFGDGSNKGIEIIYVEEENITGTLGSVTYISNFSTSNILVMNSDLLTNINFEDLYQTHIANKSSMTVATVPYEVNIPYGVIETKKNNVISLKEKPTYTYYSNAGIYIIKSSLTKEIPQKTHYNATDLITKLLKENRKVVNYPIRNYWLDIGKPMDFERAQEDIKHIKF